MTQTQAKRFFVDKVLAQARQEGSPLSESEEQMLSWSESDPDYVVDPALPPRLEAEISDVEYERKIAGLLTRSFEAHAREDPEAEGTWKRANEVLNQGDHYISVMIDAGVGSRWKSWWRKFLDY